YRALRWGGAHARQIRGLQDSPVRVERSFVDPKLVLRVAPLSIYKATASFASSKPAVATLPATHHGLRR
ncbi:hypothetical protein B296_00010598, partial [Ensete ventricosum]